MCLRWFGPGGLPLCRQSGSDGLSSSMTNCLFDRTTLTPWVCDRTTSMQSLRNYVTQGSWLSDRLFLAWMVCARCLTSILVAGPAPSSDSRRPGGQPHSIGCYPTVHRQGGTCCSSALLALRCPVPRYLICGPRHSPDRRPESEAVSR